MEQIFETIEERYLGVMDKGRWLVANGRIGEARAHLSMKATAKDMDEIYAADDAALFALCTRPVDQIKACRHGSMRILRSAPYPLGKATPADVAAMAPADRRDLHLFYEEGGPGTLQSAIVESGNREIMDHFRRRKPDGFVFDQARFKQWLYRMTPEAADYFIERARIGGGEISLEFLLAENTWCEFQHTTDHLFGKLGVAEGVADSKTAETVISNLDNLICTNGHSLDFGGCDAACKREPPSPAPAWMKRIFLLAAPTLSLQRLISFNNPRLVSLAVPIALLRHSAAEFQTADIRRAAVRSGRVENVAAVYSMQEALDPRESLDHIFSADTDEADIEEIIYSKHHPSDFTPEMINERAGNVSMNAAAAHLGLYHVKDLVSTAIDFATNNNIEAAEACWRQQLKQGGISDSELAGLELWSNTHIRALKWLHGKIGTKTARAFVPNIKRLPNAGTVDEVRWLEEVGWYNGIRGSQTDEDRADEIKTMLPSSLVCYLQARPRDFPTAPILGIGYFEWRTHTTRDMYGLCAALDMDIAHTEAQVKRWEQGSKVATTIDWPHMFEVYGDK
jgi:hypothetical protein